MSFLNPFSSPNAHTTRNANNDALAGRYSNRAQGFRNSARRAANRGDNSGAKHWTKRAEQCEREARRFRGE